MMNLDLTSFWISIKLATLTTLILLTVCMPVAWWMARAKNRFVIIVESIVSLPLILPPTVLGFYLLLALGPNGFIGSITSWLGIGTLAFSFTGLVIGSMAYSLPFVIGPLKDAFAGIDNEILEAAQTLGASKWDRFHSIILPLSRPGILTASILGFAHTIGEFGVVLMIGGNIPGKTKVISIDIYDHVESLEYAQAHSLSALLIIISFILLLCVYYFNRRLSVVKV